MFDNIPAELRALSHWVCWRYETKPDADKPTKVPYNPLTGWGASSTDSSTWTTYENAVAALSVGYNGIGFVLSDSDPYAFIDLDTYDPKLTQEERDVHTKIFHGFQGYAELSPSGQGLHLIVKGKVDAGRKRRGVEVYSSGRYMTMTGNVYRNAPIIDQQDLLESLWLELAPLNVATYDTTTNSAQTREDFAICDTAANAVNGDKFVALYQGQWNTFYPSQSEADFALIDILAFYTQNRDQIRRIFTSSKLHRAEKMDYHFERMMSRAFDNLPPPVDVQALKANLDAWMASKQEVAAAPVAAPVAEVVTDDVYSLPPGLLGEIAQYIYSAAPRQVPEIALCGAIGLMAGITGRAYNINGTGLNHYLLLLAPTGSGKEAMASGISHLMTEVAKAVPAAMDFIGPGAIRSDAALLKYIARKSPSFITIGGEFGHTMKQMAAPNAPANVLGIKQVMLDLYGKSGQGKTLRPTIYSQAENNTQTLAAPAFSFLGESAPESFFDSIDERLVSDGLLPRFTLIEYTGIRPPLNPMADQLPSPALVTNISTLCGHSLALNAAGKVITVQYDTEAKQLLDDFEETCTARINENDDKGVIRHIWNRAHLRALKLAALVAVGEHPFEPTVSASAARWAINLSAHNTKKLLTRFENGEVGAQVSDNAHIREVTRFVAKYIHSPYELVKKQTPYEQLHKDRVIPLMYLQRNTAGLAAFRLAKTGANIALRSAVKILCDNGELIALSKLECHKRYGISTDAYVIGQPSSFELRRVKS